MKVIISDIDRCQIPTKDLKLFPDQEKAICAALEMRTQIEELQKSKDVIWVHNSARSFQNTLVHVNGTDTQPDILIDAPYIIACYGTEIYERDDNGHYELLPEWQEEMDSRLSTEEKGDILAIIQNLQSQYLGIQFQPLSTQGPYKIALDLHGSDEEKRELVKILDKHLEPYTKNGMDTHGIEANYSHDHYYDITPKGINKGSSTEFLVHHIGAEPSECIVCGDSGGDVSMFRDGFKGIVPANGDHDIIDALSEKFESGDVFFAPKGYNYALGLIEGLKHFGVLKETPPLDLPTISTETLDIDQIGPVANKLPGLNL